MVSVPGIATITLNKHTTAADGTLTVTAFYISLLGRHPDTVAWYVRVQRGRPGADPDGAWQGPAVCARPDRRAADRRGWLTGLGAAGSRPRPEPPPLQGRRLARPLHLSGTGRLVARTAGLNMVTTMAVGLGGVIVARALGPALRGEYAAILGACHSSIPAWLN
jgi:hypothetical protein